MAGVAGEAGGGQRSLEDRVAGLVELDDLGELKRHLVRVRIQTVSYPVACVLFVCGCLCGCVCVYPFIQSSIHALGPCAHLPSINLFPVFFFLRPLLLPHPPPSLR
jgi:hypothetical protein